MYSMANGRRKQLRIWTVNKPKAGKDIILSVENLVNIIQLFRAKWGAKHLAKANS